MDTIFLFEKVLVLLCVIMSTIQQITGGLEQRIAPLVPLCLEKKKPAANVPFLNAPTVDKTWLSALSAVLPVEKIRNISAHPQILSWENEVREKMFVYRRLPWVKKESDVKNKTKENKQHEKHLCCNSCNRPKKKKKTTKKTHNTQK